MSKTCPECAETIKLEALVCRFCHYRFDVEDVQQAIQAAWATIARERSTAEPRTIGDAAADLKECPECHEMVWAGVDACPACTYDFHTGRVPPAVYVEPPSFTVVLGHVHPTRRSALKDILKTIHTSMPDADIDLVLDKSDVTISSGLSLPDANSLMLTLHENGFESRKLQDLNRAESPVRGVAVDPDADRGTLTDEWWRPAGLILAAAAAVWFAITIFS